jgi:hypothetical protein
VSSPAPNHDLLGKSGGVPRIHADFRENLKISWLRFWSFPLKTVEPFLINPKEMSMKLSPRILLLVLLIGCLLALPVPAVQAGSQYDSTPNPAAEAYLLSELRASGAADLQYDFPEGERVISGDALLQALKDPQVQSNPFIFIANATVAGELWANDLRMPANLTFYEMEFEGQVYFNNAQLQTFIAQNSTFKEDVDFGSAAMSGHVNITKNAFDKNLVFARAVFNGNVDLRENIIGESLNFYGTYVVGELLLDGSEIRGTQAMPGTSYPAEFWLTQVDGVASFLDVLFRGDAYFAQSRFSRLEMVNTSFDGNASFNETSVEHTIDLSNAHFAGESNFKNLYAGNTANFTGTTFDGRANFENAHVIRQADFSDAIFNAEAVFDFFTAERFIDFYRTTFNQEFSFYYTTVAWPYFENAVFNGPVSFEGMQASEDFELLDTSYNYAEAPFSAYLVEVDGAVKFTGFTAPAGLQLSQSHFGSLNISTKDNPDIAFIDLTATDIDGQFGVANVNTKGFLAEGVSIGKSTTLTQTTIVETLDLRNANIGFLKIDDQLKWPNNPNAFNLRGMTYTDIDLGDQGLTEETWQGLLKLINQSAYTPQAYESLAQFLTEKGHPDWAAEVGLAQKRRERNEVLTPLSGAWLWSWFLDIFAGYGQRPVFAFGWSGLVIVIGTLIFRRKEDMLPVEQDNVQLEYNPLWYSFALFLPYIDLGIASKWEPNPARKWARNYKYIHMMLGWILAPIALLTFSGIIG